MRYWSIALICASSAVGCTKSLELGNRVVLNVDGQEMRASAFADQLAGRLKNLDALTAKDPMVIQRTKDGIVRDFIISVLSEKWAKANNVFVRAEDLETEVQRVRGNYPDDLTFERALAEQNLTFKIWRESLARTLLQRMVAQKIAARAPPPNDDEIRNYYQSNKDSFYRQDQIQLRQVVLATEADVRMVEEQLKKGRSLAELAEKFSITPEGKRNKGLLPWLEKGVMEGFDNAFTMPVGGRSGVIKSPYGYHIFELVGRRPGRQLSLEAARPQIIATLKANREQALFTAWLEDELRKARVLRDDVLISQIRIETRGD